MDIQQYEGKRFTLWLVDEAEESVVYGGWIASSFENTILLQRGEDKFELQEDWLERIRAVRGKETQEILLGADFFLQLRVSSLADGEDTGIPTGVKWPI